MPLPVSGCNNLLILYNSARDIKDELAYKDATMVTHLLVPAYIVIFLYKSYTKVAVALHFVNGFVRVHFAHAHEDKDSVNFHMYLRSFNYDDPTWLLDVSAMAFYLIPHQTQRKWYATARRTFLMTILRREDNDLQRAFLDACAHGHADALKNVLIRHQGRIAFLRYVVKHCQVARARFFDMVLVAQVSERKARPHSAIKAQMVSIQALSITVRVLGNRKSVTVSDYHSFPSFSV